MKPLSEVRWGMIGCGAVTEKKSAPGLQIEGQSRLVAVCSRRREQAEDYAQRHGVPIVCRTPEELVAHPEVDAIYVATPPSSHLEYALLACEARKPTYVEKPMAHTGPCATRMKQAFDAADVPLFVAYYRRALPRFKAAKALLDAGEIGRIEGFHIRYRRHGVFGKGVDLSQPLPWRLQPEIAGGGLAMDLACHSLDIVDFLVGPLELLASQKGNLGKGYPAENQLSLLLKAGEGMQGSAHFHYECPSYEDSLELWGSRGCLKLTTFGDSPLELVRGQERLSFSHKNPDPIQGPLIRTIVQQLRGQDRCPSDGASGLRTSLLLHACLHS